jgi:HD-like signal output (HDOD) protein
MEAAGIDSDEVWRHLLGCALLCEHQVGADESLRQSAFTAGLLHDVGRLAMAAQAPTRYRVVVDAAQDGRDTREVERHLFGIDHAEFGQRITERWRLPDEITEAIGQHHDDPEVAAQAGPTRRALSVARMLVGGLGIGDGAHRPDRRDATAEEHPLIVALGGRGEFMNSIRWFRDSTTARRPAA